MVMRGNRVLKDQMDKRFGSKMVVLFRCLPAEPGHLYIPAATFKPSGSIMFVHYRRRPAEVSS